MVVTGTAVTLIAITLLALAAVIAATLYFLPPYLRPLEEEGHRGDHERGHT